MDKIKVKICVGTTCHLMGSHALVTMIEELPSWMKEKIEFSYSPCFEVCNRGAQPPIVEINGEYMEDVTPDKLREKLEELLER